MSRKILIMGLPGAGKTTLAKALAPLLNAVVFNADAVRSNLSPDLGFSHDDRVEHALRMGWLCDTVVAAGHTAIADFVCPTAATRLAFGNAFVIWLDRIDASQFPDTNAMFTSPIKYDLRIGPEGTPQYWADYAVRFMQIGVDFHPNQPTALFVGRYQPFHDGHKRLIEEGFKRVGRVCIAVRNTHGMPNNPLTYGEVKERIERMLKEHAGKFVVVPLPNITNIFYGRDVGYTIERIVLDADTEAISATRIRGSGKL